MIIEWAFIRRLRGRERTALSLLVCYARGRVIIEGVLYQIFKDTPVTIQASYATSTVHIFVPALHLPDRLPGLRSPVALGAICFMLTDGLRPAIGPRCRTRSPPSSSASTSTGSRAQASGIGVAVTAAGGMVFGMTNAFSPDSGYDLISGLLSIVVLRWPRQYRRSAGRRVLYGDRRGRRHNRRPTWATAVYAVLVIVLLVPRPSGLFGNLRPGAQ